MTGNICSNNISKWTFYGKTIFRFNHHRALILLTTDGYEQMYRPLCIEHSALNI